MTTLRIYVDGSYSCTGMGSTTGRVESTTRLGANVKEVARLVFAVFWDLKENGFIHENIVWRIRYTSRGLDCLYGELLDSAFVSRVGELPYRLDDGDEITFHFTHEDVIETMMPSERQRIIAERIAQAERNERCRVVERSDETEAA